jgi:replicative DNA helicase
VLQVTVAEIAPRGGDEFERTPPHDIAAEQCVLGGMLLSKDAISDVLDVVKSSDFYRPAHQVVYDVVLDLYGRGEPADAVTVAAELTRRGDIARVGGAPYLHTLIASVPTAANAGYYARIVRERAILRRLVEVGTRIVQLGYSGDGDADELVDRAEAEVYGVTDRRVSEDYAPLSEIMPGALDEIEAIGSRGGSLTGVPTGFADLDALTNGLHPGQMVVIAARPAIGKALALDTPLPTPCGWTTMGDVRPGDYLIAASGRPTLVVAATQVMAGRPCYEVEFSDGAVITADASHQWLATTRASRQRAARASRLHRPARDGEHVVVTTAELAAAVAAAGPGSHAVGVALAADFPECDLPLPPYTLGAWLGAGTSREAQLTTAEDEIVLAIDADGRIDDELALDMLRGLGMLDSRHIPPLYLRASREQRRALLAGLLDTAGQVSRSGTVCLATTSERLASSARELILSLGYQAALSARKDAAGSPARWLVTFAPADKVFRLTRKLARQRTRAHPAAGRRYVRAVRPVASVPMRCVQVDSADHTYLAGRSWIPTHNSTLALDLARAAAVHSGLTTVIFSLEMSRNEITMRLLSAEARVALHAMRTGQLGDDDWTRLARRMSEVADSPLFIDDSPNMSMMEIRAKCRRLKQRHDLRMVIIDYLQLMSSPKRVENRQQEVSELSRSLKLLAKELNVPVVALSQLNRGPEQRTDKRPMLSDLRESGCLTADTTLLRADTGEPVTLGELLDKGHQGVSVWSVDEHQRIVAAPVTNVFPSGVKETYRLRLASGREVKASGNHPFLTFAGWQPLEKLTAGARIAIPRRVPGPLTEGLGWTEDQLGLLAQSIGSGQKRIPAVLHSASEREVAVFLKHLWATDGCVWLPRGKAAAKAYYATSSRILANGVALLLSRLGIVARIRTVTKAGYQPGYHVIISDGLSLRRFCADVGVHGRRGDTAHELLAILQDRTVNTNVDTLPIEVWDLVRQERVRAGMSEREFQAGIGTHYCGTTLYKSCPSRERLRRCAEVLGSPVLEELATSDIFWDRIESIEPLGPCEVFDATVKGTHNFIADGIFAHNSIEQDSDMVILLHREDAYERESPRAGEADFIVAKHRNGPTTTVTVAFQGHYSRFVDMAPM